MKSEKEKMIAGEPYLAGDAELVHAACAPLDGPARAQLHLGSDHPTRNGVHRDGASGGFTSDDRPPRRAAEGDRDRLAWYDGEGVAAVHPLERQRLIR